ncbi:MAG: metallophosphoesterase family protein [Pseudomonadota bacterium]
MKIGVLSDTHLKRITHELREIYNNHLSEKELILHAGDIVSPEIIDFLSRKTFHGVHGNMDPSEVKELLPRKKIVELGQYRLGLIHGWGSSAGLEDRIWSEFHDVDVIVYGHSHHEANRIKEGVLLFNPGTATGYSPSSRHTIGILELSDTIRGEIVTL